MSDGTPLWFRLVRFVVLFVLLGGGGAALGAFEPTWTNILIGAVLLLAFEFLLPGLTALIRKLLEKEE